MSAQTHTETAKALVVDDKGLLAMDESNPTCNQRFAALGIPQLYEARRAHREMIVTTPNLGECSSGMILCDETVREHRKDGTQFLKIIIDAGIIPGIKVDTGAKDMAGHPGEKVTEGLDGLSIAYEPVWAIGITGKTDAWVVLEEGPEACIHAGLVNP